MNISTKPAVLLLPNFSFENCNTFENFVDCPDANPSGLSRFHPSILAGKMLQTFDITPNTNRAHYIIASGVRHHPDNWTTPRGKANLFKWINTKYLKDLQEGRAILLLDQCLEGYHTPYLWQWFHDSCDRYSIPPEAVVYVTGNWTTAQDYAKWANDKPHKIKTFPYTHFESYIKFIAEQNNIHANWNDNIDYKKTSATKTFNCLQKRLRPHRIWFYVKMFEAGILDKGLVSMNDYDTNRAYLENKLPDSELLQEARTVLPLEVYGRSNVQFDDRYYIDRIVDKIYKDTWVTVVSEPIFADSDNALFISEKTFKPIACMHPFIILGARGSLQAVRDMGYKTFDGFIDESYDNLSTFERIDAIIKELKRIDAIEDKLSWFQGMKDILEYNYNVFHNSKGDQARAFNDLTEYYREYFNV